MPYALRANSTVSLSKFSVSFHSSVFASRLSPLALVKMASAKLREAALKSPRQLYKFLFRECERLPKDARAFYRHSIKQSFKQHVIEPDKQRVEQIMKKAMQDAEWIVKKYAKSEGSET